MILLLFFISGATALVYEVVWSKCLVVMFGSTVQAQTAVLAVFMVGLALGGRVFGKRSVAIRHPLKAYGLLEVGVGIYGFLFLYLHGLVDSAFQLLGAGLLEHRTRLLLLKGALSFVLLIVPTLLMGGTLPLLAAWLQKESQDSGRWSARFYSVNSLGAVCGAGLAGFFLVRTFGVGPTLQMTGLVNALIGVLAIGLARTRDQAPLPAVLPVAADRAQANSAPLLLGACALVALSGGASMGLELLASRMLSLIFGASLQAFAVVLMAFILGIGIGAAVIASPHLKRLPAVTITLTLLLTTAVLLGVLTWHFEQWVGIYRYARSGLARNDIGYFYHQLLTALMALVILGAPAGLLGAVLPLWIRVLSGSAVALGNQVGWLLTCNTLGAVLGALGTGFALMPALGLRASFAAEAMVLSGAAVFIAIQHRRWGPAGLSLAIVGVMGIISGSDSAGWRHVMSSGVFREREGVVNPMALEERKQRVQILFYEDAADATVTVERVGGSQTNGALGLRVNGKVDASSESDMATQRLLAHLPLLARPQSTDVFVLGLGSGVTAGAVLGHPVERLTVAENCEPVLRAAKFFEAWNGGVLEDPRTRLRLEDGRTVLKLSKDKYDVIISEPSNPWMVGIGSVFSEEFYQLAASRLKEGGVICQWFHVYEMNDALVVMILRTFSRSFPFFEIWDPGVGDVILVGAQRPWASDLTVYQSIFDRAAPRQDLEIIGIKSPAALWARQLASQRTSFAIPGKGPIQSDNYPILEYDAPKAFFQGSMSRFLLYFDERTWQADLAEGAKRQVLGALDDQTLMSVFGVFSSVNSELDQFLALRQKKARQLVDDANVYVANRFLPCIFRPPIAPKHHDSDRPLPGGELEQLMRAEELVYFEPARWLEGVAAIEQVLQSRSSRSSTGPAGWSVAHYAALAAKAYFNHGDRERAVSLVRLGQSLEPHSPVLGYLDRLFVALTRSEALMTAETPTLRSDISVSPVSASRSVRRPLAKSRHPEADRH
jgi:predicted membrane-bound spermidine synthase